jgi:hypothetical protein
MASIGSISFQRPTNVAQQLVEPRGHLAEDIQAAGDDRLVGPLDVFQALAGPGEVVADSGHGQRGQRRDGQGRDLHAVPL